MAILKKKLSEDEAKKLKAEDLESVNGGLVVKDPEENCTYYIVVHDETGLWQGFYPYEDWAREYANKYGQSMEVISREEYERRFNRPFQWPQINMCTGSKSS